MRNYLLIVLGCLAAVGGSGCDDDTATIARPDLSAAVDLASPVDATPGGTNCSAVLQCVATCAPNTGVTCGAVCVAKGTPAAQSAYMTLQACALLPCGINDGGTPPCLDPASTDCSTCLQASCPVELAACLTP